MSKISKKIVYIILAILVVFIAAVAALAIVGFKQRAAECPGGKVDLKGMGEIIDYKSDNGVLRLRLKKPNSEDTEVVLVDECTGRIKGSLTIDDNALKLPEE
ncbi:MAG: hypothetical protein ACK502_08390 [Alphaproteobacteria bacterium]